MDPTTNQEHIDKFVKHITDIVAIKGMEIDDDLDNVVITLKKIESRLNYLAEARNHLQRKDATLSINQRVQDKTIDNFERDLDKERKEKNFNEKQEEKLKKEFEAKEK